MLGSVRHAHNRNITTMHCSLHHYYIMYEDKQKMQRSDVYYSKFHIHVVLFEACHGNVKSVIFVLFCTSELYMKHIVLCRT